jgi:N-acetylmuramoyl-L-alanine amidase
MKSALRLIFAACLVFLAASSLSAANKTPSENAYVSVTNIASSVGMSVKKSEADGHVRYTLSSKWSTVELEEGSPVCRVNDVQLHLSAAPVSRGTLLYMMRSDYKKTIEPLLLPQKFAPAPDLGTIVIDPGHGGRDDGAQNKAAGIKEKVMTLDLAARLKTLLEERGYRVLVTRTKDEFIELPDRPAYAVKVKADLFISLHFNASTDTSVFGAETYILPPAGRPASSNSTYDQSPVAGNRFDEWNVIAAYYVQRELVNTLGAADRGVRRARFAVLRPLSCPGMLVESGYVSNRTECAKIAQSAYRDKIATAIANAVDAYSRTVRRVQSAQ